MAEYCINLKQTVKYGGILYKAKTNLNMAEYCIKLKQTVKYGGILYKAKTNC